MLDKALIGGASALAAGGIGFGAFAAYRDRKRKREAQQRDRQNLINNINAPYQAQYFEGPAGREPLLLNSRDPYANDVMGDNASFHTLDSTRSEDFISPQTTPKQRRLNPPPANVVNRSALAEAQLADRFDPASSVGDIPAPAGRAPPVEEIPLTPLRPVQAAVPPTTPKAAISPGSIRSQRSGGSFDIEMSDLGSIQGRSRAGSAASSASGVGEIDQLVPKNKKTTPVLSRTPNDNTPSVLNRFLSQTQRFFQGPNPYQSVSQKDGAGPSSAPPSTPASRVIVPETSLNSRATPFQTAGQSRVPPTPNIMDEPVPISPFNPRVDAMRPLYATPIQVLDSNSQLNRTPPATIYRTPAQSVPSVAESAVPAPVSAAPSSPVMAGRAPLVSSPAPASNLNAVANANANALGVPGLLREAEFEIDEELAAQGAPPVGQQGQQGSDLAQAARPTTPPGVRTRAQRLAYEESLRNGVPVIPPNANSRARGG